MIKYLLFDLDGTLTDPGEGITNSVAYALSRYGIEISDKKQLNCFIGPPLAESFMKYYDFDEVEAYKAVDVYREYFADVGIFENVIYSGIDNMLNQLVSEGKELILATSKPEVFAIKILDHFDISKYFRYICGSLLNGERVKKSEVIDYAIKAAGITDRSEALMIGDRHHDIDGGKACGLSTVGVTYGYGSLEELVASGADNIVASVNELTILLKTL